MKAAGMAYLKRAVELLRTQVLGMEPSPQAQAESSNVPASQRPRGYTQALLDRFQLPQARWPTNTGATGADFYNFLASAVNAAASAATGTTATSPDNKENEAGLSSSTGQVIGAFPSGDMSASGTLVPPSIRDNADKMTFLAAQRERLNLVLSALDREAAQLRSTGASPAQEINLDGLQASTLASSDRPATSHSGKSLGGLSKSRSEADFEKIEAESGAEDNTEQDRESAKPTPSASGGSWLPWGWSGSGASAKDEKSKEE